MIFLTLGAEAALHRRVAVIQVDNKENDEQGDACGDGQGTLEKHKACDGTS
jgi:hypothetical protein